MENSVELEIDTRKALEEGSIRNYIVENVSIADYKAFCADEFPEHIHSSRHDVYIPSDDNLHDLYDACKEEICTYSHPSDVAQDYSESLEGVGDHFEGVKTYQIDICVRQTLKSLQEKYGAAIDRNPAAKNLRDVIGCDIARFWYDGRYDCANAFANYKTLEELIKDNYTGRELMFEVNENRKHGFYFTKTIDGRALYDRFHMEINRIGDFEKHRRHNDTQLTETIVSEAIYSTLSALYKEHPDAIEKNPDLSITKAIARENSPQQER